MSDVPESLIRELRTVLGNWASFGALGAACLYAFGYLSLRYHITTLGISTELSLFDERYLFAGARVLIFFALCSSIVVLVGVLVAPFFYLVQWMTARRNKCKNLIAGENPQSTARPGWTANAVAWAGILLSVVTIQCVLTQPLQLHQVSVASNLSILPPVRWIAVAKWDYAYNVYFSGLLVILSVAVGLFMYGRRLTGQNWLTQPLYFILLFLIGTQILLLPVNHGILVADNNLPHVMVPEQISGNDNGKLAWLVWDGKESFTFVVWDLLQGRGSERTLVALKKQNVKNITVKGFDRIFEIFFTDRGYRKVLTRALNAGICINEQDHLGRTFLMKAAEKGYKATVIFLLKRGADPTIKDESGETALDFARRKRHAEVVKILQTMTRDSVGSMRSR